ncbi:MAG: PEP/pyruvate-binding domain-containing protein [bacterium]|nr:PEP/pyruvate-binding domain-containing protein [bacterium]
MIKRNYFFLIFLVFSILKVTSLFSQPVAHSEIQKLIQSFKKDFRGPYQAIRWFCPDGSIVLPQQRCPQPGGIQHALHKNIVQKIAEENKIYLGQILAGTPMQDFWDAEDQNSRLKQYQMEKYLQAIDDGWIFRRARFYRGAIQVEDEEAWGIKFLTWLLSQDEIVTTQFFLVRQAARDLPHAANDNRMNKIRAVSKTISDSLPSFIDIRVKIHGQPDASDLQRVRTFRQKSQDTISASIDKMLKTLEQNIEQAYKLTNLQSLEKYLNNLPASHYLTTQLKGLINRYSAADLSSVNSRILLHSVLKELADLLWAIRIDLLTVAKPGDRLTLIDLSNELEAILFRSVHGWRIEKLSELLQKNYTLAKAAAGCGFIETWEWETIKPILQPQIQDETMTLEQFREKVDYSVRAVEWSAGMVRANYDPAINIFYGFEPLISSFIDDRIRSSILLSLGEVTGKLSDIEARFSGIANNVMGISNQNQVRGLNAGFAFGELQVISEAPEQVEFSAQKIYVMLRPPMDLKPVAGIATVSEGNMVSHVQLLCKNLGIPNANISQQNLNDLLPFSGQKVFYAVSPRGTVIMKPAQQMTAEEQALVAVQKRSDDKISVPVDKINLKQVDLLNLRKVRAYDSGKICGPKAANLGQLKKLFPDKVVEGIVIPFGMFRQHMDQMMPEGSQTYWQFLQETFNIAHQAQASGVSEPDIEKVTLQRLEQLREGIKKINLLPEFTDALVEQFSEILGAEMGRIPVFIRSDTNMEDLKDFTGAGLNLTVFNVVDREKILQGIRDVWASPYSERSYRWRQKFLLNPENVYPSILIIPSVNVQKSGVMITTGVSSGDSKDVTIAFNRGAGGAVEGQSAESYLLRNDGRDMLLSPARETRFISLPAMGGTQKPTTFLNQPILIEADLANLRELAAKVRKKLPGAPGIETEGPFDIELGILDNAIWLFQVRPYVENKRAKSSAYLLSLDPEVDKDMDIPLNEPINQR